MYEKDFKIVLDTSPIISLAVIDRLKILTQLFDKIFIPAAVRDELRAGNYFRLYPGINPFFKNKGKGRRDGA
ncbi:MAG: hypothetical protein ACM3SY_05895 [Candidatus Omnitrophota bacterium]